MFYSPWDDALLVTADGGGDTVNYSHRSFGNGAIKTIYGGDECLFIEKPVDSLGRAYSAATLALGFRMDRHEGKLTGLAALGEPVRAGEIGAYFRVDENGRVYSTFSGFSHMRRFMRRLAKTTSREDLAASIQKVLEDTMLCSVENLLAHYPRKHLGVAGGVFANVRLNRLLAERLGLDEIFIFPAMGDEGLPVGSALIYLMERDGLESWLDRRRPLGPIFLGRDYTGAIDPALAALPSVRRIAGAPVTEAAPPGRGQDRRDFHRPYGIRPRALGRARSWPIRRGVRRMICSTSVSHAPSSCRSRRWLRRSGRGRFSTSTR